MQKNPTKLFLIKRLHANQYSNNTPYLVRERTARAAREKVIKEKYPDNRVARKLFMDPKEVSCNIIHEAGEAEIIDL